MTQLETSNGTFTYEVSDTGTSDAARAQGDLGASSGLSVSARPLPDPGSDAGPPDPTSIVVSGNFTDNTGESQSFFMILEGVPAGGSAPVGDGSAACLDDVASCTAVTGTIDTTSFVNDCRGEDGCALTVSGHLVARTTWPGGSFGIDVALGHEDIWASSTCP